MWKRPTDKQASSDGSTPRYLGGGHGHMASAVARAYNGRMGAKPPAGSRSRAPGAEAETLLVLRHSMEAANLPTFLKIRY